MSNKRAYDLGVSSESTRRDLYLAVDKSDLTEAQSLKLSNLLTTSVVSGQGAESETVALTPKALTETTATTGRKGIIEIATDTEAATGEDSERALVPSNLASIFDELFKVSKSYALGDLDETASNYTSMQNLTIKELIVGDMVVMQGSFNVTIPDVDNIEIVINATKTPLYKGAFSVVRLASGLYNQGHGGVFETSSGKLKLSIGNSNGGLFGAGTYEITIGLNYIS